jgi:hypothetical protein
MTLLDIDPELIIDALQQPPAADITEHLMERITELENRLTNLEILLRPCIAGLTPLPIEKTTNGKLPLIGDLQADNK